jgi:hypothetical protein
MFLLFSFSAHQSTLLIRTRNPRTLVGVSPLERSDLLVAVPTLTIASAFPGFCNVASFTALLALTMRATGFKSAIEVLLWHFVVRQFYESMRRLVLQ